jgi:RNA polymerase sigma-70 factor (ECF subfamily)
MCKELLLVRGQDRRNSHEGRADTVAEKGRKESASHSQREASGAGKPSDAAAAVRPGQAADLPTRPAVSADRSEFERELLTHTDALYAFGLKLSQARDDAEDLVSETVMRALEKWQQFEVGTNMRAWLFTILYHSFVSRKRRVERREVHPSDERDGWSAFDTVGQSDPEGEFFDSIIDDQVSQAIDELPDEYREAVVLSDLHELRYAEIAQILGVPEGTVKSRLFRARRILQKKLLDYAVEMGYLRRPPEVVPA